MLIDPTPQETRELLAALYESFPTGEEFEAFLSRCMQPWARTRATRFAMP
jgi:hypothetical protein